MGRSFSKSPGMSVAVTTAGGLAAHGVADAFVALSAQRHVLLARDLPAHAGHPAEREAVRAPRLPDVVSVRSRKRVVRIAVQEDLGAVALDADLVVAGLMQAGLITGEGVSPAVDELLPGDRGSRAAQGGEVDPDLVGEQ